jgi:threonine dehydrogenase-like Zn-dependent dehydrogenase
MKALFLKNGNLQLINAVRPSPVEGEALIRVHLAGICNTDIELLKGYMSFTGIPGHEFVGTVEQSSQRALIGKRVAGEINAGCGRCSQCLEGDSRHCAERTVLGIDKRDGAFAQYVVLPDRNLVQLPDSIPDETAVLIEPLAAAMQILSQVRIIKENKVLIIGDGKLGLLTTVVLKTTGAKIFLSGHHRERNLKMLSDIEHIDISENPIKPASFDIVVEASGNVEGFMTALKYIKPKGIIILKSTFHEDVSIDTSYIVVNEIIIIGSRCGRFEHAVHALSVGDIVIPNGYVDKTFSINEGIKAVEHARERGVLKVLVKLWD